ncbi:MAG TPA: multiheme c-type cytochrome [Thermodesulfovibrionales bacterium]|nr:multiheme c-type cytochrome [Thermodesulfovibrionales bacterium]
MNRVFLSIFFLAVMGASFGLAFAEESCLSCHEEKTPGIVRYWKESIHFKKEVGCTDCHGNDAEANHRREVIVDAARCGACHKRAFSEHSLSKHGIGAKSGRGCTRNIGKSSVTDESCIFCHTTGSTKPLATAQCGMFLSQSPEMQRQGCDSCHRVESRCDTCHTKHGTDLTLARKPETCGTCHMGPDHAQLEMWESSSHGVIYRQGGERSAPSCATCHMNGGSHNVSRGITVGLSEEAAEIKKRERDFMLSVCSGCHTATLARRSLDDADKVELQSWALVEEARNIVTELNNEGLLVPSPSERPPHPLFGKDFVIGHQMLYENLSLVESLYFKMKQFSYMSAYKGAFHQNPDYAHWYGNAPLKLALSEIKSEASLLRQMNTLKKRIENLTGEAEPREGEAREIERSLRELREKRLRGEISEKEYRELKESVLKEKGL